MRVGANAKQYHRIKKMHAEGIPAPIIAKTFAMEPQSLEKILAHLVDREEILLEIEDNPEVQALRLENAELAARLANFESGGSEVEEEEEE